MVTIDDAMLAAHGIVVSDEDRPMFMQRLQEQVEEQIGLAILAALNDQDAESLLALMKTGSDEDVAAWLQQNLPGHQEIAQREIEIALNDVAASQADAK